MFSDISASCDTPTTSRHTNIPSSPLKSPTSTQTSMTLSAHTPRKEKLRKKVQELRRQNISSKKAFTLTEKTATLEDFDKLCDQFLPEKLSEFVKVQARLSKKKPTGRRYSMKYKEFALALYFLGPRAYNFLKRLLYLPSKRVLERMTERLIYKPGLYNEALYKSLQIKVEGMQEEDKHCILCVDEMALKANLFYHVGSDEIVGFTEIQSGKQEFEPAYNATVIMARGLYTNWKQPLSYFFVNSTFPAGQLKTVLEECVTKLSETGLIVDAIVSDMGSNFIKLTNNLGVTPENPEFYVGNKKIVYIFDTPHLIKATRNNLLKNYFLYNGKKTSWTYIKQFYDNDKTLPNRCAPKLTDSHINPNNFQKMKVKLATQVLSHTVASGMNTYISLGALPAEAMSTVEVIEKFNKLFDVLNSSFKNTYTMYQTVFKGEKYQLDFLNEMYDFIQNLQIFNSQGRNVTSKAKFLKSWLVTINGIKKLWEELKRVGFKYLMTRRVNQDCLENFFGSVRQQGGNCINPTPIQFERAFKKLFCQNYFHSENTNCANDFDHLLTKFKDLNCNVEDDEGEQQEKHIPFTISDTDYRNEPLLAQNAFTYVCGYLVKKALVVHSCEVCEQFAKGTRELDNSTLFTYFKAFDTSSSSTYGALHVPNESFLHYIYKLEKIFVSTFDSLSVKRQVAFNYFEKMKNIPLLHKCSEFPVIYVLKLFIRLRIFYSLKFANRSFTTNKANKQNRKISILSHL